MNAVESTRPKQGGLRRLLLWSTALLVLGAVLALVALALARDARPGVFVSVHNGGSTKLVDVTIVAGDFGCVLGDIGPGVSRGAFMKVDGDANLMLVIERAEGRREHHDLNVYIEPRTLGWVGVTLVDGTADSIRDWTF